jgi:two-component system cell cycle response regulator
MTERINRISQAADRIANIVKKIQTLRHDEPKHYAGGKTILNLDQPVSILSIEDRDNDFSMLEKALFNQPELKLSRAKGIDEALDIIEKERFDLIFLEYLLPDGNGLDFLETINTRDTDIPVVVLTGQGDEMIASRMIQAGASDYLPKAKMSNKALLRIISNALEKSSLKREMRIAQEKLTEMSIQDELTGMFNRRYFQEALERELSGAQRYKHSLALCIIDLDHFKLVNDSYGHLCGDYVLQAFGRLLKESIRMYDVACRYGGEEFAVLLPDTSLDEAISLCDRFRERVCNYVFTYNDDVTLQITASVGVTAHSTENGITGQQLVDLADKALYRAKSQGRNKVVAM